jgi:hypothetical protein
VILSISFHNREKESIANANALGLGLTAA